MIECLLVAPVGGRSLKVRPGLPTLNSKDVAGAGGAVDEAVAAEEKGEAEADAVGGANSNGEEEELVVPSAAVLVLCLFFRVRFLCLFLAFLCPPPPVVAKLASWSRKASVASLAFFSSSMPTVTF